MSEDFEGRPPEGSLVRMKGDPDGQVMLVTCSALGEEHLWEGVNNGIYCTWDQDGEEMFEVFRPGQLDIVKRPPLAKNHQQGK